MSNAPVILGGGNPLLRPVDLVERIRPWVAKSIQRYQLGQPVAYTVTFGIVPNAQGQAAPRIMIYFETASGVLGQTVGHMQLCDTNLTESRVDDVCKDGVAQVMGQRAETLKVGGLQT